MTERLGAVVAMSLFIVLSSVTFLVMLDVWNLQSTESSTNAALIADNLNTRVSITSTASSGGCGTYTVGVSNPDKTHITDFSKVYVIVDYQDGGGGEVHQRLDYVTGAVGDNEWALNSITPDIRDPNAWNPGETVTFDIKVNPNVSSATSGAMVVGTPFGVTDSAYFGC